MRLRKRNFKAKGGKDMADDKGTPKQDGSGHGNRDNKNRGGCESPRDEGQGRNPKKEVS